MLTKTKTPVLQIFKEFFTAAWHYERVFIISLTAMLVTFPLIRKDNPEFVFWSLLGLTFMGSLLVLAVNVNKKLRDDLEKLKAEIHE